MVSTDSEEIAETARRFGARVPFLRSRKNADDYATTADALLEVMERYQEMGRTFSYLCCIYPTAPFVTAEKLRDAMRLMEEHHPSLILPVVAFSYPPQRSYVVDENGCLEFKYKEYSRSRSQDLEKWYHDAGQFYMYDAKRFLQEKGAPEGPIMPIYVSELQVQDIDSEDDFKIAELKYQLMKEKRT